jgi:hypothetical protein
MEHFDAEEWLRPAESTGSRTVRWCRPCSAGCRGWPEETRAGTDTSSLEVGVCGRAVPGAVKRAMIDWLGPVITEYYGATEGHSSPGATRQWLAHPAPSARRCWASR